MAKKIVAANWKMQGTTASVDALLSAWQDELSPQEQQQAVVFAPFVFLPQLQKQLSDSNIAYGAQTVSQFDDGAYTGEISTNMLQQFGCGYALVGHSERRQLFGESDDVVGAKFAKVQAAGMTPMLCIGETLAEREAEQTINIVQAQLQAVLDVVGIAAFANAVVAYEPIWAIGTGKTASPDQAQAVHAAIRGFMAQHDAKIAADLSLLYGGSVKASNAKELFAQVDIDGALVGGASLDAAAFIDIVKS
jgi:triosephosphate isomerase